MHISIQEIGSQREKGIQKEKKKKKKKEAARWRSDRLQLGLTLSLFIWIKKKKNTRIIESADHSVGNHISPKFYKMISFKLNWNWCEPICAPSEIPKIQIRNSFHRSCVMSSARSANKMSSLLDVSNGIECTHRLCSRKNDDIFVRPLRPYWKRSNFRYHKSFSSIGHSFCVWCINMPGLNNKVSAWKNWKKMN